MKRIGVIFCVLGLLLFQMMCYAAETPSAVLDVRKSVVRVIAEDSFGQRMGSGFAVGTSQPVQYIVTNNHVIDGATKISILLSRDNIIEAYVQTSLPGSDLAVLRVATPLHNVKPAIINDKTAKEGTAGYALGYPAASSALSQQITGNTEDVTITDGIVSALQSVPYLSGFQPVNAYQVNVDLNSGNSGGPFVNSKGEVIGICSWGAADAQGINAAIRVSELTNVLSQNGIPYLTASNLNMVRIILIAAIVLVILALVFLIIMLIKRNKKAKGVLYGINGEFAGERFYIPDEGVNIGRDAAMCQIVLPVDSAKVSRSHCNLRYDSHNKTFILTDLASANGTYLLNGIRLEPKKPAILSGGTKFYLGDETTTFRVGIEE